MAKRVIDPIYKKYASRVISAVASTDFYDYFMEVISAGQNTYQFSNRHVEKSVDERWVIAVESTLQPMEEIINNPRNFIMTEEAIVNVALAKKVTPDTIRHLAQHGDMIDSVTDSNVRPNRLMEKFKEDSWNTYENRFVYTLLEMAWDFVDKRYDAIFAALGDECGSHLKVSSDSRSLNEHIKADIDIRIQEEEDLLAADERSETIFARIARCHRILSTFKSTGFAKTMAKYGKIKPPLFPTNAIKKNPNFKACHKLWNFILAYNDVGYKIDIFEQSNEITEDFETDIKHSIMFDYIILKNYLQIKGDRIIDTTRAFKKKAIKPTYIKEVIEEIVKNYDLPDVEIKKVLIEEINKAQLLKLEEDERLRLVAEKEKEMKARRREEEKAAKKQARADEREKLRQEKERLKELERQEKAKENETKRLAREEEKRLEEEASWIEKIKGELGRFDEYWDTKKKKASVEAAAAKKQEKVQREKEIEREKKRAAAEKQKEKDRLLKEKEKQKAKEKAEKERLKEKKASDAKASAAKSSAKKTAEVKAEEELTVKTEKKETVRKVTAKTETVKTETAKAETAKAETAKKTAEKAEKAEKPEKAAEKPAAGKKSSKSSKTAEAEFEAIEKTETTVKTSKPKAENASAPAEEPKTASKTEVGTGTASAGRMSEPAAVPKEPAAEKAPEAEAPKAEAPKAEAPKAEAPETEASRTEEIKPAEAAKEEKKAEPEKEPAKPDAAKQEEAKPAPSDPFATQGLPESSNPTLRDPFGEPKPIGVTDLGQDIQENKGIKSIFRKLFK